MSELRWWLLDDASGIRASADGVHPSVLALAHARRNLERVAELIDGDVKEA